MMFGVSAIRARFLSHYFVFDINKKEKTSRMASHAARGLRQTLNTFIKSKIRATGPITVAEYMQLCATAYYTGEKETGEQKAHFARDFTTAPEVFSPCN